ncbi:hypothetical protein MWH25_02395 [Natroniella acetigena]|uniref:hypothetical protein n=1 Tax=Natroniella acetigena TaxID=52004 RepID=UPI00200AB4C0|nr:hypothetical protein [Natroniella acetigena]MCK8826599.1 hypothetical protein [Natroniella acetigena]
MSSYGASFWLSNRNQDYRKLRREKLCTQVEGEHLVSFANTADPPFMVGVVTPVTL